MIDFSRMRNEEIVRNVRRKLYRIICEHVKNCDDENTMEHIERFLEGVSWSTGLNYRVWPSGEVHVYLRSLSWAEMRLFYITYAVIDIYIEIKMLRNSINRHYYKITKKPRPRAKEAYYDERD